MFRSHRASLLFVGQEIPEGTVVDHLCGVRNCVNPAHLECISQKENVQRGKDAIRDGRYIISEEDNVEIPEDTGQ